VHLAVDLRILDREGMERTGLGRYALGATRAVHEARPDWRLTVHSNRPELLDRLGDVTVRRTRWPTASAAGRSAWLHLAAARAERPPPNLWWGPAFVLPLGWSGAAAVTIHDLLPMLYPELYRGRLEAMYVARATRRSARRADRVLCGSATTRERILSELGVDPERVALAPWGVDEVFRMGATGAESGYLLFVGRWEARKGLDVLLAALREAAARDPGTRLMLAGGPGRPAAAEVAALRAEPNVETALDPSDQELASLYAGATALVYPSRMEGFGFPVAEAMASGCPVIASDLPELRELAGDAAVYFPPGDSQALADAMIAVAEDPDEREGMAARGRELAARLTWEGCGETTAQALEAALEERSRARSA
jgi:glycosyltransferase involved in cell wall biosynthesis